MIELQGLPAPFTIDWLGVWIFAILGGVAASFIKINDIDKYLKHPTFAKIAIGTTAGVVIGVFINQEAVPPPPTLIFWAFIGAVSSSPIVTGFLVFISNQDRQNDFYRSAQNKFLPWTKHEKERKDDS